MKRVWLLLGSAFAISCTVVNSLDELTGGPLDEIDASALDANTGETEDASPDAASASKYRAAVMEDKPVGYWRLGEKSGDVARDEIGAHNGTYVGGVTLGTSQAAISDDDTAVTFDGTSGRIVISNVFGFEDVEAFSVETWIKVPIIDDSVRYVASKLANDAGSGWSVSLNKYYEGLGFAVTDRGTWSTWNLPFLPNAWVHHVGTYTESNLCVYLDGNQAHCFDPANAPSGNKMPLVFGASGEADGWFRGSIDEIAVYDHELTAERVKAHYDARK